MKYRYHQAGFTLLEVVIVIFLIGLFVSTISFTSFQTDDKAKVKEEAQRLQVLIDMASDFAILNQQQLGIYIDIEENTYEFVSLQENDFWAPIEQNRFFRKRTLPDTIFLELNLDGLPWQDEDALFDREIFDEELSIRDESVSIGDEEDEPPPPPQILILSSGDLTPFELKLEYRPKNSNEDYFVFALQGKETTPVELVESESL